MLSSHFTTRTSAVPQLPSSQITEDIESSSQEKHVRDNEQNAGTLRSVIGTIGSSKTRTLAPFATGSVRTTIDTPRKSIANVSRLTVTKPGGNSFKPVNTLAGNQPTSSHSIVAKRPLHEEHHEQRREPKRQRIESVQMKRPAPSLTSKKSEPCLEFTRTVFSQSQSTSMRPVSKKRRRNENSQGQEGGEMMPIELDKGFEEINTHTISKNPQLKRTGRATSESNKSVYLVQGPPRQRDVSRKTDQPTEALRKKQQHRQTGIDDIDELAGDTTVMSKRRPTSEKPDILSLPIECFAGAGYCSTASGMQLIWDDLKDSFYLYCGQEAQKWSGKAKVVDINGGDIDEFAVSTTHGDLARLRRRGQTNNDNTYIRFVDSEDSQVLLDKLKLRARHNLDYRNVVQSRLEDDLKSFFHQQDPPKSHAGAQAINRQLQKRAQQEDQPKGTKRQSHAPVDIGVGSRTFVAVESQPRRMRERMQTDYSTVGVSTQTAGIGSRKMGGNTHDDQQMSSPAARSNAVDASRVNRRIPYDQITDAHEDANPRGELPSRKATRDEPYTSSRLLDRDQQRSKRREDYSEICDDQQPEVRPGFLEDIGARRRSTRTSKPVVVQADTPPPIEKWSRIHRPEPWSEPVVYPPEGQRRITVEFRDLERLDEGEFLNDTLISFGLRRIEEKLSKDNIHFFNSYFYSALSSNKGTKGFNYEAVKRWTKNTDILSTEFIVVPINHDLHWFTAIICNLPTLQPPDHSSPMLIGDVDSTEERMDNLKLAEQTGVVSSPTADPQNKQSSQEIEHEDPQTSDHDKSPRRPRKRPPPQRKYDTKTPAIVTLDSFGTAHTTEIAVLKDYITAEVWDKRQIAVARNEIYGITAKNLVEQTNFCDCGLFVIGYLEAFARDPRGFIDKTLSRSLDKAVDFAGFDPSKKRAELRDDLLMLYAEQQGRKMAKKQEKLAAKSAKSKQETNEDLLQAVEAEPSHDLYQESKEMRTHPCAQSSQTRPAHSRESSQEMEAEPARAYDLIT